MYKIPSKIILLQTSSIHYFQSIQRLWRCFVNSPNPTTTTSPCPSLIPRSNCGCSRHVLNLSFTPTPEIFIYASFYSNTTRTPERDRHTNLLRSAPCTLLNQKRLFPKIQMSNTIYNLATMHTTFDRIKLRYKQ